MNKLKDEFFCKLDKYIEEKSNCSDSKILNAIKDELWNTLDKIVNYNVVKTPYQIISEIHKKELELSDIHTRHCCKQCGCKYGDSDCSVFRFGKLQEWDCGELQVCGKANGE